jgi:hypothetical protein
MYLSVGTARPQIGGNKMSVSRRCEIFKAVDNKFYLILGKFEHAEELADCNTYGPFGSAEKVETWIEENESNPGGCWIDNSGTRPVPANVFSPRVFNNDPYFRPF